MNIKLTIKNFRVFDENGVTFDLAPITILTGCNSSGKSSIVKAILLWDSFLKQIKNAREKKHSIEIDKYKLDFSSDLLRSLGNFNMVLHRGSSSKQITIRYESYSRMLSKNVNTELVFAANNNDDMNNGYLESISLSTEDGVFFHSDKTNGNSFNFNIIKKDALSFLVIEFVVNNYNNMYSFGIEPKEFDQSKKQIESFLSECDETRKNDIIQYARFRNDLDSIVHKCKVSPEILNWSINNEYSLFYIPVIDELNNVDKKDIKNFVKQKYLQNDDDTIKDCSNKILDDFIESEYATFGEYFRKYETEFLTNFPITKPFSLKKLTIFEETEIKSIYNNNYSFENIDFDFIYEVIMHWNRDNTENKYYEDDPELFNRYEHYMFERLMMNFASDLILEVLTPDWCESVQYASSSRTKVQRLYTFDDNNDFNQLLKKYFDSKMNFKDKPDDFIWKDTNYEPDSFMNSWVKTFGIGEKIELKPEEDGTGVKIKLYKTSDDKNGRLLADEGYGITSLFGILLKIEIAILTAKGVSISRLLGNGLDKLDGYDSWKFHYEKQTIAIEEPEIHLHPRFQSLLADMVVYAYKKYNIHFIIETHSEYLIRKLQTLIAKKEIESDKISIAYIYNPDITKRTLYTPQIKKIEILTDGRLDDKFGEGFFDEADRLAFELLMPKTLEHEKEKNSIL